MASWWRLVSLLSESLPLDFRHLPNSRNIASLLIHSGSAIPDSRNEYIFSHCLISTSSFSCNVPTAIEVLSERKDQSRIVKARKMNGNNSKAQGTEEGDDYFGGLKAQHLRWVDSDCDVLFH